MIDLNRRGYFKITSQLLEDDLKTIYDIFIKIDFIIHEAKYDFNSQSYIYKGTSPKFSELYEGCEIPYYTFEQFEEK